MPEYTEEQLVEIVRNAQAYGWEVGRGNVGVGSVLTISEDNPFAVNPNPDVFKE